jgi:hypothetical protein
MLIALNSVGTHLTLTTVVFFSNEMVMNNIPLLIFDLLCLPFTIIRLTLIYFFGSRYNIPSLQFLDIMFHARNRFFNQGQLDITVDTMTTDVRIGINRSSRIDAELLNESVKHKITFDKIAKDHVQKENEQNEQYDNTNQLKNENDNLKRTNELLQKTLFRVLEQLTPNDGNSNHNIDTKELDKTLDDEIRKELDFLSDFNVLEN